jgi:hypothetical protein
MMFANDDKGEPTEIKLLDFQMSAIAHPVIDLCYFFYVMTDRDFRRMHLDQCLRWYFDTLSCNYLADNLKDFSYNEFEKEFNVLREGGSWVGLVVSKLSV